MSFSVQVYEKLKSRGYKITSAREDVVMILACACRPLSPYEIKEILDRDNKNYQVITIYRVLELLQELDLVHKIYSINSYQLCNSEHKHNHKFLICKKCHAVDTVELKAPIANSAKNFVVVEEINEALGLCSKCQ
jgi:Fur family zinc uptake transcriptional regulator